MVKMLPGLLLLLFLSHFLFLYVWKGWGYILNP